MKQIIRNTWEVWCLNLKKECTQILSCCWISTVYIQVLSDNTIFASALYKDQEFLCLNFINQKMEKKQKRLFLMIKIKTSILHKKNFAKNKSGDFCHKLLTKSSTKEKNVEQPWKMLLFKSALFWTFNKNAINWLPTQFMDV
jgi:hypothetical protein